MSDYTPRNRVGAIKSRQHRVQPTTRQPTHQDQRKQREPAKFKNAVKSSAKFETKNRFEVLGNDLSEREETNGKKEKKLQRYHSTKTRRRRLPGKIFKSHPSLEKYLHTVGSPWHTGDIDETSLIAHIQIRFNNAYIDGALVDTGACCNLIGDKILRDLYPTAEIKKTGAKLSAANGTAIKTFGYWKGTFWIKDLEFQENFFVYKMHDSTANLIILGNQFLRRGRTLIDYDSGTMTFRQKFGITRTIPFGVFVKKFDDFDNFNQISVDEIYTGPQFIYAKSAVIVPPGTISTVKVRVGPHKILTDTVFVGNPSLVRRGIRVSDFILSPSGDQCIQVTNFGEGIVRLDPNWKLAVDEENECTFTGIRSCINGIKISNNGSSLPKFQINEELSPAEREKAEALLESFRDVFISDVSELRRCKYPPIRIHYEPNKIVRQRNYRMSVDEKDFAEK
ncbi:Retroviral-like aspartic protease 1 [Frankliniella fusca]|uniref:Retroviral-like aspartic protease 1 n=1 Tax=Frankliniella fusca TaxID=407009 RepID=A0AAE1HVP5_9NEOP|nr:Retroviral-like aspartic protease 1 [Frankliniella fusca]